MLYKHPWKDIPEPKILHKMCRNTRDPQRTICQYGIRPRWPLRDCWSCPSVGVAGDRTKHHSCCLEAYGPEATSSSPKQKVCTFYLTPCLVRLRRMSLGHPNLACDWRLGASGSEATMLLPFTTIPLLKKKNSPNRLYGAPAQRLRAFKGKKSFYWKERGGIWKLRPTPSPWRKLSLSM